MLIFCSTHAHGVFHDFHKTHGIIFSHKFDFGISNSPLLLVNQCESKTDVDIMRATSKYYKMIYMFITPLDKVTHVLHKIQTSFFDKFFNSSLHVLLMISTMTMKACCLCRGSDNMDFENLMGLPCCASLSHRALISFLKRQSIKKSQ